MKKLLALWMLAAGCAASACAAYDVSEFTPGDLSARDRPSADPPKPPPGPPVEIADKPAPSAPGRLIIFNGSLLLQVADAGAADRAARKIAEDAKGWVHRVVGTILTIRVPAEKFHETVQKLEKLGRVLDRRVDGTDVTEEYRDLEIRIRNSEAVLTRLTKLLENTKNVKEALEVERELARVTEEIERMKGRLQRMADQIACSTITIDLRPTVPETFRRKAPPYPFRWLWEMGLDNLQWVSR